MIVIFRPLEEGKIHVIETYLRAEPDDEEATVRVSAALGAKAVADAASRAPIARLNFMMLLGGMKLCVKDPHVRVVRKEGSTGAKRTSPRGRLQERSRTDENCLRRNW